MIAGRNRILLFLCLFVPALYLSCFIPLACAQGLPLENKPVVVKGRLPLDPKYWDYNRWYINHSVVDVVVRGDDNEELTKVLAEIKKLQKQKVMVRKLIVVGGKSFSQLDQNARRARDLSADLARFQQEMKKKGISAKPADLALVEKELIRTYQLQEAAKEVSLGSGRVPAKVAQSLEALGIENSPLWIVSYHGNQYLYEGFEAIAQNFSWGEFKEGIDSLPEKLDDIKLDGVSILTAKHEKRSSHNKFAAKKTAKNDTLGEELVFAYPVEKVEIPPGAGTYDVKPACAESRVRQNPVLVDSPELNMFDIVYYDYHDNAQAKRVLDWKGSTEPYLEGDLTNPYRLEDTIQQPLARLLAIKCLPTRVRYIFVDGIRYEEYREGDEAWQDN